MRRPLAVDHTERSVSRPLVIYLGQTGLGKSTLINTLFASHLIDSKGRVEPTVGPRATTEIHALSHGDYLIRSSVSLWCLLIFLTVIVENGVRLKLNIIDTPGYGDNVNNEGCWDPIIKYVGHSTAYKHFHGTYTHVQSTQIKDQHSAYLRKELTAMRDRFIPDTRIHCCLFFINPTGHTLKPVSQCDSCSIPEILTD